MSIHVPQPADAVATPVHGIAGRSTPRENGPSAHTVLDVPTAKVVAFEFGAGQELHEHSAAHPVLIRVVRGRVDVVLTDGTTGAPAGSTVPLGPDDLLHLTPHLRHAVRASEASTLTVTMLLGPTDTVTA